MKLHLNAIGGAMLSSLNVVMVNYYCGRSDTAYFQLAFQLFLTILIVPQALGTVLSGITARLGVDKVWELQRRAVLGVTLLMLGVGGLAFWLAPILIRIVAGPDFLPAGDVFRILLLGLIGGSFAYVMANQWLGRGLFWQAALLTLAYGIANVVLNIVLLPEVGILGAAWANAIVYCASVTTNLWMVYAVERHYRANQTKQ
jgi:O-antigen/teichoic acid export membrane protein